VDEDGVSDISVTLKAVTNGVADMSFAAITAPSADTRGIVEDSAHPVKSNVPLWVAAGVALAVVAVIGIGLLIRMRHRSVR
jgi:type VI protein secretion system component VasF